VAAECIPNAGEPNTLAKAIIRLCYHVMTRLLSIVWMYLQLGSYPILDENVGRRQPVDALKDMGGRALSMCRKAKFKGAKSLIVATAF
jgi:hypothetical protein